jgi:hypothetical protein
MAEISTTTTGLTDTATVTDDTRRAADTMGRSLSDAFGKGIAHGQRFKDVLGDVKKSMADLGGKSLLKPIELSASNFMKAFKGEWSKIFQTIGESLAGMFSGLPGGASLGALTSGLTSVLGQKGGSLLGFAKGGVVNAPSYFPLGRDLGVAGEAGPEAILPLARGADGRLGVRSDGGRPVSVVVHVSTPDADSFRRSEAQVSAALARAVARGQRAL